MESEDTSTKSGLLNEDDRLDGMVLGGQDNQGDQWRAYNKEAKRLYTVAIVKGVARLLHWPGLYNPEAKNHHQGVLLYYAKYTNLAHYAKCKGTGGIHPQ